MDSTDCKGFLNTKSDLFVQTSWPEDALESVKLDPAVLEAKITLTDPGKRSPVAPEPENVPESNTTETKNEGLSETQMFEETIMQQKAALLSLAPEQLEILLKYAALLRRKRLSKHKHAIECAFCKNNGEPLSWYSNHVLKDAQGRVRCPVLRGYRCPTCGASGDFAHTIKYCPENYDAGMWGR